MRVAGGAKAAGRETFLDENINVPVTSNHLVAHELLSLIVQNKLFGLIKCDIGVPRWDSELIAYFEQFPPICKNAEISLNDIGEHMKQCGLECWK